MSQLLAANDAGSTLAGSISNTATTANLQSGTGILFPSPGAGQFFVGTFTAATNPALQEIVHVTNVTGDTITMVRGQEGTTPLGWSANDLFDNLITAGSLLIMVQQFQAQSQSFNYAVDTGSVNNYLIALTPAVSVAPTPGMPIRFVPANTNTGDSNINAGWGLIHIVRRDGSDLEGGELIADFPAELFWNGSVAVLLDIAPATSAAITAGTDEQSAVTPAQLAAAVGTVKLLSGQCYLQYSSGSQLTLVPKNGNQIPCAGAMFSIPAAGINVANSNVTVNGVGSSTLANSANYLVAFNQSSGLEFWSLATGHNADTTTGNIGVEVITGHANKTLVGMCRTNSSGQFVDSNGQRFVLSWFNRQRKSSRTNFSGDISFTATTVTEIDASIENGVLVWNGGTPSFNVNGTINCPTNTQEVFTAIAFNGTTPEQEGWSFENVQTFMGIAFSGNKQGLSEGYNYATLVAFLAVSASAMTFKGGNAVMNPSGPVWVPFTLEVTVDG